MLSAASTDWHMHTAFCAGVQVSSPHPGQPTRPGSRSALPASAPQMACPGCPADGHQQQQHHQQWQLQSLCHSCKWDSPRPGQPRCPCSRFALPASARQRACPGCQADWHWQQQRHWLLRCRCWCRWSLGLCRRFRGVQAQGRPLRPPCVRWLSLWECPACACCCSLPSQPAAQQPAYQCPKAGATGLRGVPAQGCPLHPPCARLPSAWRARLVWAAAAPLARQLHNQVRHFRAVTLLHHDCCTLRALALRTGMPGLSRLLLPAPLPASCTSSVLVCRLH